MGVVKFTVDGQDHYADEHSKAYERFLRDQGKGEEPKAPEPAKVDPKMPFVKTKPED